MRVWTNLCYRESWSATNCWQELHFEFSRQNSNRNVQNALMCGDWWWLITQPRPIWKKAPPGLQRPSHTDSTITPRIIFRNQPTFAYCCQPKLWFYGLTHRTMLSILIPISSKGWALLLVTVEPSFRTAFYGFSLLPSWMFWKSSSKLKKKYNRCY